MFLDGDWKFACLTTLTTGAGASDADAPPSPARALGAADDDEVRPGDEENEHPAKAPTRTNAASFEMTAIVSGSLWAPGKTPGPQGNTPHAGAETKAATHQQEP